MIRIEYKEPHLESQLKECSTVLQQIIYDASAYVSHRFDKSLIVTRVYDPVSGESGVHLDKRAADARHEYRGTEHFTEYEALSLVEFINTKWKRNDGFQTVILHSFGGGPRHFHFQIPTSVKVYETNNQWRDVMSEKELENEIKEAVATLDNSHGIKNVSEVLIAANKLTLFIISKLKGQKNAMEIIAGLLQDVALQDALKAAADGIQNVPAEVKDLDVSEGFELASIQIAFTKKIIEALKV